MEQGVKVLELILTLQMKDVNRGLLFKIVKILAHVAAGGSRKPTSTNTNRYFSQYKDKGVDCVFQVFKSISQIPSSQLMSPRPSSHLNKTFSDVPESPLSISGHHEQDFTPTLDFQESLNKWEEIKRRSALCYCYLMREFPLPSKSRDLVLYLENLRNKYPIPEVHSLPKAADSLSKSIDVPPSKEVVEPKLDDGPGLSDSDWGLQIAVAWDGLKEVEKLLE